MKSRVMSGFGSGESASMRFGIMMPTISTIQMLANQIETPHS